MSGPSCHNRRGQMLSSTPASGWGGNQQTILSFTSAWQRADHKLAHELQPPVNFMDLRVAGKLPHNVPEWDFQNEECLVMRFT